MLIFIYKLIGDPLNNYWVNYYWLVSSLFFMIIFIDIQKVCFLPLYKLMALMNIIYWGIMAALRIYLFFNIDKHYLLVDRAGQLCIGSVFIILSLIFLTAKTWFKK